MKKLPEPIPADIGDASRDSARRAGLSRREFVRLLSTGGALALFGTSAGLVGRPARAQGAGADVMATYQKNFVEGTAGNFYWLAATVAGSHWWKFTSDVTPAERLFLRARYKTPIVDKAAWKLRVTGDAIERPMDFSYADLAKMRSLTAVRYHECMGNGGMRGFGLIGQVEWHYVPIGEILDRVRPKSTAAQALFWSGVDGPDTGRPIDVSDLRARPEAIGLAYGMNGTDLPPDHGSPVRAIVPGWGGVASIKWLSEIRITRHRFWTRMNTKEEALLGPAYAAERPGPNDELTMGVAASDVRGVTAKWQTTKSHLNLPVILDKLPDVPPGYPLQRGQRPTLKAGRQTLTGYAYSPLGIQRVDYSADGGATWRRASLTGPTNREIAWTRFKFDWNATPGDHALMTRATDKKGNVQPAQITANELDILDNGIPRFDVRVA
ncbi:MAG TPA: molybdopterin-dependent oxidoreductase [bacterium]|nr:molybdopterin-dependent oxidoreductase [bacterium]